MKRLSGKVERPTRSFSTIKMTRQSYDTDLTDGQWLILEPLLAPAKPGGRPRSTDLRKAGRQPHPSAACIDSQSVKTAGAAQESGFDGGKKVKERKRTILVDTMGLLLCAVVHRAGRSDHAGLTLLGIWFAAMWGCLKVIWTDSTFGGKSLIAWVKETFHWNLEVVQRQKDQKGFQVLPRRWVVERTLGWFGRYRRLSKDDEYLPTTSETMLYAAMVNIMVRRLA